MNWTEARRKLLKLATGRPLPGWDLAVGGPGRGSSRGPGGTAGYRGATLAPPAFASPARPRSPRPTVGPGAVRASSLCVASGKGGTGKSVVSAALSTLFSMRGRTLLLDLDLGVGNAHILQDVTPPRSFVDVVEGRARPADVLVPCGGQLDLIAGGSGVPRMADLSPLEMHLVAAGLAELDDDYRFLLVDSAAGVSPQTLEFARACDVVLIVTTPDLTAMTDAYAFLKVIVGRHPCVRPFLVVNRATGEVEAREVAMRIRRVCRRFLGREPRLLGWIPDDPAVTRSVNDRGPVVLQAPGSPAAAALRRLAVRLLEELHRSHPRGMGRSLLENVGPEVSLG